MIKYTVYKMGRIVVNKHFDDKSLITSEKFVNKGEIIVSNQKGYEGIVITNNIGEMFFIGPSEGTGSDVPVDYKEYVNETVDSVVDAKLQTQGALTQVLSAATVEEFANLAIFSGHTITKLNSIDEIISGFSASTIFEINRIDNSIETLRNDFEDIAAGIIDEAYIKTIIDSVLSDSLEELEGDITETVANVSKSVIDLEGAVSTLSGTVDTLKSTTEGDVNRIDNDILSLRDDVDALRVDLDELSAYTKNLVILTRPKHYKKSKNRFIGLFRLKYKAYPKFIEAMSRRADEYNSTLEYIYSEESAGNLFVLQPKAALPVSRVEKDPEKLMQAYAMGREAATEKINEIIRFLA